MTAVGSVAHQHGSQPRRAQPGGGKEGKEKIAARHQQYPAHRLVADVLLQFGQNFLKPLGLDVFCVFTRHGIWDLGLVIRDWEGLGLGIRDWVVPNP